MSAGPPNDRPPRMPWELETPEGETNPEPAAPPPSTGWTPPTPTDPTTVWKPAQAEPPPPAEEAPPSAQGGLISSAPIGWAPPPPAATEVAPGLAFADTTSRVVAYIVDAIILGVVVSILASILNPATTSVTSLDELLATPSHPAQTLLVLLIDMAYFVGFWTGGRRATIGQRLFNIQVGNAFDGRALTLEQAVRRWLAFASWISLIGIVPGAGLLTIVLLPLWDIILLITTATSPTKQGLHDRFANTALVRPSGQGTSGLAQACIVIVVVLLLLAVVSIIALLALGDQVSRILSEVGESI